MVYNAPSFFVCEGKPTGNGDDCGTSRLDTGIVFALSVLTEGQVDLPELHPLQDLSSPIRSSAVQDLLFYMIRCLPEMALLLSRVRRAAICVRETAAR